MDMDSGFLWVGFFQLELKCGYGLGKHIDRPFSWLLYLQYGLKVHLLRTVVAMVTQGIHEEGQRAGGGRTH